MPAKVPQQIGSSGRDSLKSIPDEGDAPPPTAEAPPEIVGELAS